MNITRRAALLAPALALIAQAPAQRVRIGQATPALSFLPIMAARALDLFPASGLTLEWAAIPGGDPAALAALDSGDIDYAAVGSETLLNAISKGQPFQIVASLMSKVSLEFVVSNALLTRTGLVPADDPLPKRLQALKGAIVGVSAIGGTQDRAARWLARQGGIDPKSVQVAMAGPPPAIQAALEAGRIDAFLLSPPEGLIAEDARTGKVLIRMGDEFPALAGVPSLVLAAKTPVVEPARLVATLRVLQAAAQQVATKPDVVAPAIQEKLFPKLRPQIVAAAITSLKSGVADRGKLSAPGITALLAYAGEAAAGLDPTSGNGKFWTNQYWDEAAKA